MHTNAKRPAKSPGGFFQAIIFRECRLYIIGNIIIILSAIMLYSL